MSAFQPQDTWHGPSARGLLPFRSAGFWGEAPGALDQDPIWVDPRSEGFSVIGAFVYRAPAGATVRWTAEGVPSGVYGVRIAGPKGERSEKIVLAE